MTIEDYIRELEEDGILDPQCRTCKNVFYPQIEMGKDHRNIFAPPHKPSPRCESGKNPHCTCNRCF